MMKAKLKSAVMPAEVRLVIGELEKAGFEAYAVGGCARDFLLGRRPADWDVTTSASPEVIQKIFPKTFYENRFGTVTVLTGSSEPTLTEIEVTPFRLEGKYTDRRHPDEVTWAKTLEEDLSRRDFTINAIALGLRVVKGETETYLIDPFGGQKDLKKRVIRTVGEAEARFNEDALRMLRAARLAITLGSVDEPWKIETKTLKAIKKNDGWLAAIAKERIRDELVKIIMSSQPEQGILLLKEADLLKHILPELEKGVGITQNRHHIYTIFEHLIMSLKFAAQRKYSLAVRLAALFHDIAKPQTKRGEWPSATFYNHDILGAKITAQSLERLKFSREMIERVANLVRNHMFVYDVEGVTEAGVRRLLRRAGPENMQDLLDLRITDRLGSGCPKAVPYKLRHLQYVIKKVSSDPISVQMLKINGHRLMEILEILPGPRIGLILNALLSEVLENPELNKEEYLEKKSVELNKLNDDDLKKAVKKVEEKKQEVDIEEKKKFWL